VKADSITWGILGPGRIANQFANGLRYSSTGRLVAVASRDLSRAEAFATEYGADRAYGDYDELLADPEIDAVYISTVHTEHARWAIRAAEAGKHVLCEKPLSPEFATSMGIVDAGRKNGVVVLEGYMYLFHPQTTALLGLVADGVIGEVQHIDASYSFRARTASGRLFDADLAGGGILDVGGYPASAAQAIVRAAGEAADAVSLTARSSLSESGVDQFSSASVVFAGGITAHLTSGIALAGENRLVVSGSLGTLTVPRPWVLSPDSEGEIIVSRAGEDPRIIVSAKGAVYALEADAVAAAVSRSETDVVELSTDSSLALARLLQRWRIAAGVVYAFEGNDIWIAPQNERRLGRRANYTATDGSRESTSGSPA